MTSPEADQRTADAADHIADLIVASTLPRHMRRPSTLGNPDRPGAHMCLRCGHRWDHLPRTMLVDGRPRSCPLCKSHSWWLQPTTAGSRSPDQTDWDAERRRLATQSRERKKSRKVERAVRAAAAIGIKLPRPQKARRRRREDWKPSRTMDKFLRRTYNPPRIKVEPVTVVRRAVVITDAARIADVPPATPFRFAPPPPRMRGLDDL